VLAPAQGSDLLLDSSGTPVAPLVLDTRVGSGASLVTLTDGSAGDARLVLRTASKKPGLELRLTVDDTRLGPVGCTGGETTDLTSRIALTDADGTVTGLNVTGPWGCRQQGRSTVRLFIR
jgi:hypothetical protein